MSNVAFCGILGMLQLYMGVSWLNAYFTYANSFEHVTITKDMLPPFHPTPWYHPASGASQRKFVNVIVLIIGPHCHWCKYIIIEFSTPFTPVPGLYQIFAIFLWIEMQMWADEGIHKVLCGRIIHQGHHRSLLYDDTHFCDLSSYLICMEKRSPCTCAWGYGNSVNSSKFHL